MRSGSAPNPRDTPNTYEYKMTVDRKNYQSFSYYLLYLHFSYVYYIFIIYSESF